ncbi:hypothetical protein JZ751_026981 [Albula glossodonta]|uniref:CARD domain-containing protein n=1 Tax=Albula glossodonta TaxID=121402 RepID=A0A8T2NKX0_9TELE|nr:hypothetical protein JZ751_026981 [Albula glossodonta]
MACTQQSALKYIRNSTTHLIGRLRNLPLIVEKLHQCRVLNEYEVSDINSIPEECKQTRRILEMVIAEGEEACYEFLKILDVTRKRTLPEQQQDFSAFQNGSSCDLHQSVVIQESPSSAQTVSSFLHNTMQEFWAALWLLENPEKISEILLRCQTEEGKYLRYILPFLCGFLFEQNSELVRCVVPEDQVKTLSEKLPVDIMNTFLLLGPAYEHENARLEFETENLLFVCQCLYESRSEKACSHFLKEVGYHFDLREENLDPHQCCAVSYVINQAEDRSVQLDLENSTVTDPGWKLILSCVKKVQMLGLNPSMFSELWETALHCGQQCDFNDVLRVCGSEIHFPVQEDGGLCETAGYVMKQSPEKVKLCLHWDKHIDRPTKNFTETISQCLSNIATIRFIPPNYQMGLSEEWKTRVSSFKMDLCLQGVFYEKETGQKITGTLMSALSLDTAVQQSEFLLDLYSRVKDYETQTGSSVLSALQTLYQSAPAEWFIDLSKRKASLFLEVLKLQRVKKPVNLMGWTDEESEGRIFLECLPYISQLRCDYLWNSGVEKAAHCVQELWFQAVVHEAETGQTTVTLLSSVYSFENYLDYRKICITHSTALLDLYSRVKDYETQTGRSVLSALQTLYQSAPAEWVIDLSKRKASLFLEVLKLQTVKRPVKLMGWTDEESEVRIFLECLPYISQLSCDCLWVSDVEKAAHCVQELCFQAVVHEAETGQRTVTLLSSVYSFKDAFYYRTSERHSTGLLDLYSRVKDYETQTGRSVLSALQTLYQSAPAEWVIDLSKRKASLFLEVLKLQRVKKPVNLMNWTDEESEGRIFLECLPYISELRCDYLWDSDVEKAAHCEQELCFQAVVHEAETGQRTVTLLSSVYSFKDAFYYGAPEIHSTGLLDLYSRVKDYETQTGRSVLLALQTLYQSVPAAWDIDLSKRKASLFLEVLKLQRVMKPVNLMGWTDEEGEVRIFLECLPYISQLRLDRSMTLRLARVLRAVRGHGPVMLEELSLNLSDTKPLATARTLSSLTSLLRLWTVCEVGEEELTRCFLEKVGGDLTGCTLDWNMLHCLLQHSTQPITVDLKKSGIKEQNIRDLLPFLHRIQLKRVSSRLIMAVLREVFEMRAGHLVTSLVKSAGNWIILNSRVLDSKDCAALRFTLSHADCVGLGLIWTSITEEEIQRTVPLLSRVSQLRVDRKLLLKLLHSCMTSEHQQGAAELLQTLQFKLDFSCSRSVDLTAVEEGMSLCLSVSDCRAISMAIQQARCDTQLVLEDCTVDDAGLEELYPILHRVHLRVNKPLLLQLVCKTPVQDEGRSVSRAAALLRALGGELELSCLGTKSQIEESSKRTDAMRSGNSGHRRVTWSIDSYLKSSPEHILNDLNLSLRCQACSVYHRCF